METLTTPYGQLIPQHTSDDLRKREIQPVEYYESGQVKSVPLETQTLIDTPAGPMPAELVSFHENGCINRIFPLNGKLSGYWSQDDEAALAKPVTIASPIGVISAKVLSVSFYDNKGLRSLTLWPDEKFCVRTPVGSIETRIGVCFTPDGKIRSLEPAKPATVPTPAGDMTAFDPDAIGVNGDSNSLVFNEDGQIRQLVTTLSQIKVVDPNGHTTSYAPQYRQSFCGDTELEVVPMTVRFLEREITIQTAPNVQPVHIPLEKHVFFAEPYLPQLASPFTEIRCSI